jgi:drug/metabolite transporter (DMT)-like permease
MPGCQLAKLIADPPVWLPHLVCFCINTSIGIGIVVGKIGLVGTSPVAFVFVRNSIALPIVASLAYYSEIRPSGLLCTAGAEDAKTLIPLLLLASSGIFASNVCYTVGTKLENPVIGAAWQASVPVWISIYGTLLGLEKATWTKFFAYFICFAGASFVLFYDDEAFVDDDAQTADDQSFVGNIFFFLNVNGFSVYCLVSRRLIRSLRPLTITAIAFAMNSCYLGVLVLVLSTSSSAGVKSVNGLLCPDCTGTGVASWGLRGDAVWALAYFVIVFSVLSYSSITWCNKFIDPSKIGAYNTFQPVSATFFAWILVGTGYASANPQVGLEAPGWNAMGTIGGYITPCMLNAMGTIGGYITHCMLNAMGTIGGYITCSMYYMQ